MLKNEKGKVSKTKVGSMLLGLAGTVAAVAQVPGLPVTIVPWLNVAAVALGGVGAALGGVGLRNAVGSKR